MSAQRNEPCPCGSGKKYKQCCADKQPTRRSGIALAGVLIFGALAVWAVSGLIVGSGEALPVRTAGQTPTGEAPPGQVWNEEHGHWHPAEGSLTPRPAGQAPAGSVWSEEHGHWHPAEGQPGDVQPGEAPPGHVWSEEHGHWHDVNGQEFPTDPVDHSGHDHP